MKTPYFHLNRQANIMVIVLMLLVTLSALLGAGALFTQTLFRNVARSQTLADAVAIADGHLEVAYATWRKISRERPEEHKPASDYTSLPIPATNLFPGKSYTLDNFAIETIKPTVVYADGKWDYPRLAADRTPDTVLGQTSEIQSVYYLASADVTLNTMGGPITARVRRIFEKQRENPWQYAIFFQDICEMHPGPEQVIDGWVHTNSTLYTAHNSLRFEDKVTFAGDWEIGFAPGDTNHKATPVAPRWNSNIPPAQGITNQPLGFDPTESFDTTDNNPNNDGYIELVQRPVSGHSDPLQTDDRRLYYQASVRVHIDNNKNVTVYNANGTQVTANSSGINKSLYEAVTKSIVTGQQLQDNRVGASVRVSSLDVAKFGKALDGGGKVGNTTLPDLSSYDWNGVIYMVDTSANPSNNRHRAVRLQNGAYLPARTDPVSGDLVGMTFVSENPIYIQGDYNTGSTYKSNGSLDKQPRSNTHNKFDERTVSGYQVRPAAVLGDAVNVLSNAWSDSNSTNSVGSRKATNTTINTAIVSGNVPTGPGVEYSGGVENFPRFLEDWGGKYFTYYGSMIQLFRSEQANYRWGKGNVYSAPNRRWFFEETFLSNPPPGFLYTIKYSRQRWYMEF